MLTVEKISVKFGRRDALVDVSFDLREGEIVALLGPNGAGKTTLIKAMNGSVARAAGEVIIDGVSVSSLSRRETARRIAVVAQENETRFPVTVIEFVLAGRFAHGGVFGWETANDISAAHEALAECDLDGYAPRLMNELSGGERQRVVLARAAATDAGVLLLDEPTANLDLRHQAMMFHLVRDRCQARGASAVVITHDLNLAAEFADKVMMLNGGRITAIGKPADVLTAQNISAVFGVNVLTDENPVTRGVRITALY